jgi:hypothetical protein
MTQKVGANTFVYTSPIDESLLPKYKQQYPDGFDPAMMDLRPLENTPVSGYSMQKNEYNPKMPPMVMRTVPIPPRVPYVQFNTSYSPLPPTQ